MLYEVENWITSQLNFNSRETGSSGQVASQKMYAIVDGSRQPMIIPVALEAMASRVSCLYSGGALSELGDNAAWVVELLPGESTLRWLLEHGFEKRWFIFASSDLVLESFVRHLKKFTVVKNERGETLFFRFYDPHVLRQYLPMFSDQQRVSFFKNVTKVFFEDTTQRSKIVQFSLSDTNRLLQTTAM